MGAALFLLFVPSFVCLNLSVVGAVPNIHGVGIVIIHDAADTAALGVMLKSEIMGKLVLGRFRRVGRTLIKVHAESRAARFAVIYICDAAGVKT